MAPNEPPSPTVAGVLAQPWVVIAGLIFAAVTLLYLMYLGVFQPPVACDSRFIVAFSLSFGAALSVAFLGGNAAANGALPFGLGSSSAMNFSVGGGIGVLVIVLVMTNLMWVSQPCLNLKKPFGDCPAVSGSWQRGVDFLTMHLQSDGCEIKGTMPTNTIQHMITGHFDKQSLETRADIEIARTDGNACKTIMSATLWPWPYGSEITGLRVKINSNDGHCISATYHEDFFYDRQ